MKLWYDKKSKDPTYFIQMGIRHGKKVTCKNVCRIGKHSELLYAGHSDPLAYAKEMVIQYNDKMNSDTVDTQITINFKTKLSATDDLVSKSTLLNIGYFYLQKIYNDLKLKDFFDNISKDRKYVFNANDINRFLTFDRILAPKSKYAALGDLANFYENLNFAYHDVLRFMDVLTDNYDSYLTHLYENSENIVKRETSICYYDCTNYYFEIEQSDSDIIDEKTGNIIPGFRKYGISKEHRPNPIVQMGLFMDKHGIPLTMSLFPGNVNEQKTAVSVERKLIKSLKNKKIIYCADAGLSSTSIRLFNDLGGRAFIVAQSIKKLSIELQNKIFNDDGYKLLSDDSLRTISDMKSFNINNENNCKLYNDKIYKIIEVDSLVDLGLFEEKTLSNGKTKIVKSNSNLKQRIIVTFSRKMYEYQRNIRNNQIERAKTILKSNNVETRKKGPNDVMRFIKNISKTNYEIDEAKIAEEEKFDGFYAIATNIFDENIKDIININANRYKIEDCFRILKTNFEARPVYHRLENRIIAHFMICYTALLIYRLLENKLLEKGYYFTINDIITTLKNMTVASHEDLYYQANYTKSKVLDALEDIYNLHLDHKYYKNNQFTKLLKKL